MSTVKGKLGKTNFFLEKHNVAAKLKINVHSNVNSEFS